MLRHCASSLGEKRARERTSEILRAEYYLGIEGFLLHLRNVLAFFTNRKNCDTDLVINEPDTWAGRAISQCQYSDLMKSSREFDRKYGVTLDGKQKECYDEISKFLQHCTTHRCERAKRWPIEEMLADIDPVCHEFEKRFAINVGQTDDAQFILGVADSSTASFRKLGSH